jgi:hypothetical protein
VVAEIPLLFIMNRPRRSIRNEFVIASLTTTIVALTMIATTTTLVNAFSITTTKSRSTFLGRCNNIYNLPNQNSHTKDTALYMNLFDRFTRVAKSNLNNILQILEDPEKIMTQALEDMQVS